jgi:hypothetical protein
MPMRDTVAGLANLLLRYYAHDTHNKYTCTEVTPQQATAAQLWGL